MQKCRVIVPFISRFGFNINFEGDTHNSQGPSFEFRMNDEYYFYVEDNTIFILKDDNRENNYWGDGVHFKGVPIKHEQFDELFVSLREEKINQILCQK